MHRTVLLALAVTLLPLQAQAISRYNSTSMTCGQVKATIRSEGAVIMRWRSSRNIQRYGRYVAHDGYCPSSERAEWSYIPTADRESCPVLECKQYSPDDDFWWLRRRW